jgi:hypothetical protein
VQRGKKEETETLSRRHGREGTSPRACRRAPEKCQSNDAETLTFPFIATVHVFPFGLGQPTQPRKLCGTIGLAVKDTEEPDANAAEHIDPQVIPAGLLVMVPSAALPVTFTERMFVAVPCGHPRLAGPSTVIDTKLLTMSLGLSCMLAKICATPQFVFGDTVPGPVNWATCGLSDCHVT